MGFIGLILLIASMFAGSGTLAIIGILLMIYAAVRK